jgi:hypothetical protein
MSRLSGRPDGRPPSPKRRRLVIMRPDGISTENGFGWLPLARSSQSSSMSKHVIRPRRLRSHFLLIFRRPPSPKRRRLVIMRPDGISTENGFVDASDESRASTFSVDIPSGRMITRRLRLGEGGRPSGRPERRPGYGISTENGFVDASDESRASTSRKTGLNGQAATNGVSKSASPPPGCDRSR